MTQTGIQLLSGFLLTLPFQARFERLDSALITVYLVAVVLATTATALVVAPVVFHRLLFRRQQRDVLVGLGHVLATAGMAVLALTVALVAGITFAMVVGDAPGWWAAGISLAAFGLLWFAVPLVITRRRG